MLSKGPNSHKADGNEHGGNGNNAAEDKLNGGVTLDFEGRPNHRSEQSVHGDIWKSQNVDHHGNWTRNSAGVAAGLDAEHKGGKGNGNAGQKICQENEKLNSPCAEKYRAENSRDVTDDRKRQWRDFAVRLSPFLRMGGIITDTGYERRGKWSARREHINSVRN